MAGGPGSYLIGEEERKEVLDVLESVTCLGTVTKKIPHLKRSVLLLKKSSQKRWVQNTVLQ